MNLDSFGFDVNSPLCSQNRIFLPGMNFDSSREVQKTRIKYSNLVRTFGGAGNATTTVKAGKATYLGASIFTNDQRTLILSEMYLTIYEGTFKSPDNQIYPKPGNNIAGNKYKVWGGYAYRDATTGQPNQFINEYIVSVYNSSGADQSLYFEYQHKYLAYV